MFVLLFTSMRLVVVLCPFCMRTMTPCACLFARMRATLSACVKLSACFSFFLRDFNRVFPFSPHVLECVFPFVRITSNACF